MCCVLLNVVCVVGLVDGITGWCAIVGYLCCMSVSELCALCGSVFRFQIGFCASVVDVCCMGVIELCVCALWGKHFVVELVWT